MRARVIAISVVAHGAMVGGLLALAPRRAADPAPRVRDIEVVATAPKPPPPPPPASSPPARSEPMRDRAPTRIRKPAAGRAPAPEPTQPAGGGDGEGSGSSSGESGGGNGDGDGAGDGEVLVPIVDRSGPPVPIDAIADRTLPYTAAAQRDHVSGDIVVSIEVDPLGHVARATVQRGLGHGLDEIATKVATQLRFKPATDRRGAATTGRVKWRFHFQPP